MISYTLICQNGHESESWFASSEKYDELKKMGLVACPICDNTNVEKALMAPSVSTAREQEKAKSHALQKTQTEVTKKIYEVVKNLKKNAEDVGEKFPEEARKTHYGESDKKNIIGKATIEEAKSLIDEGISILPLPDLPEDKN